jgi:hypothetical protein
MSGYLAVKKQRYFNALGLIAAFLNFQRAEYW